jgi:hypothetical protein
MRFDMRCVSHPQAAEKKRVLDIKKGEAEGAVLTAQAKVRGVDEAKQRAIKKAYQVNRLLLEGLV